MTNLLLAVVGAIFLMAIWPTKQAPRNSGKRRKSRRPKLTSTYRMESGTIIEPRQKN